VSWPDTNRNKYYEQFRCDYCSREFPGNGNQSRFCCKQCHMKWELYGDWSVYVRVGKYHFVADNRGINAVSI